MNENDFDRRRFLLTERLKEQIKHYNRQLLIQNANITFFVFLLPILFGGAFVLFGEILSKAASATHTEFLINGIAWMENFIRNNSVFHYILISIGILFIIAMVIFHISAMVNFSPEEIKLAGYLLASTHKNSVLTYQKLRKVVELRSLSYSQMDKVMDGLQRMGHLRTEEKETKEMKTIIRDSEW
jgi:hypothetical protein